MVKELSVPSGMMVATSGPGTLTGSLLPPSTKSWLPTRKRVNRSRATTSETPATGVKAGAVSSETSTDESRPPGPRPPMT
jgi:hypothetical protein